MATPPAPLPSAGMTTGATTGATTMIDTTKRGTYRP
jgi:hypothetical protein